MNVIKDPCGVCRGSGVEKRAREVKVRVPAGVANGQRIRLPGKGAPGRNGGPSGDLFIVCHVGSHPIFGRDGDNLTVSVPITFSEAVLGADVDVPLLTGGTVTVRVKSGTQSGARYRVKGRGIETARRIGDLIVTVDVMVPTDPSPEESFSTISFSSGDGSVGTTTSTVTMRSPIRRAVPFPRPLTR